MSDPLFHSAHAALTFSFQYNAQQYEPSIMARLMGGSRIGRGLGLVGIDGAGQAGMVLSELERLDDRYVAILTAKMTPHQIPCNCHAKCCSGHRPNETWRAARDWLADHSIVAVPLTLSYTQFRRMAVDKYFGKKITIGDMATKFRIERHKAGEQNAAIREYLKQIESQAWGAIEESLRAAGMVGEMAA